MTTVASAPWTDAPLVALDLEGSGAQDHDDEAILEIALVPIVGGRLDLDGAYTTLINPERPIPRRPWISPGLTNNNLAEAPPLADVEPELAARLDGHHIIGHNVGVDWRLLHRHCPKIKPAGIIDTLRLARHIHPRGKGLSVTGLLERHNLAAHIAELAPGSQPHRAAWDATAVALLLTSLIGHLPEPAAVTVHELQRIAGLRAGDTGSDQEQLPLLDV